VNAGNQNQLIDDLAGAILDGAPIDWESAESSADQTDQLLLTELKLLAALSEVHRGTPPMTSTRPRASSSSSERNGGEAVDHWWHLRLLERIGRGAFGEVYRAWDTRLDREVALKLLPAGPPSGDHAASSIIHEGRLLARVRHPNVVTIHGAEQIGNQIGLWMEFVRGHTLEEIVQQTQLSSAETVDIGLELCRAVSAVHRAGLLHRDIKAHNVMRAEDGRIVLMDFGTGRELADGASSDLAGTPLYLAPEVLEGQPATVRSDIYSLGVLLYHLVTGSYPVHARTVREVRGAHERGDRTTVQTARRDVPSKLARIIERAIDRQPERRYQSADALSADLTTLKPRSRLVRLAFAFAATGALILVVGVAWEVGSRQIGSSRTPSALLAGFTGLKHVSAADVNPIEQPVIAVLPFKNQTSEPDSEYFVDGLTDEIIRNLAVIQGLRVRSRTSSFAFKDKPRNLRDVAEQLGVNLVVEGSVLRSGTKLRINASLIQVAGDVPLWSDRFDRELKDVFAIQDEISRAIVNKLRLTLGRGQRRYDTNVEAYELYLKARALLERGDYHPDSGPRKAAALFEQVIAKDAAFAPAYAGLADAHAIRSMSPYGGDTFDAARAVMGPAAAKALQLDPLLAEAHAAMGWVHAREFDWENADTSFRRAIDLNATLSHVYTSYSFSTLRPVGKHAEAERLLRAALRNDPLSLDLRRELARVLIQAGRYDEAIENFERTRAVNPDFPVPHLYRALTLAGRVTEAIAELEKAPGHAPWLAHAYVRAGRRADAERLAIVHRGLPFREANIYAALGDKDRAFQALERMFTSEPQRLAQLLAQPEMAVLHGDLRLVALRKKLRLP
jgi:serine/threonine protein kinase/tetratricopeptide (TPR) repeat protein